jgi:hypothetical protein
VKIVQWLRFAASGWLAGVVALVLLSLVWPNIFPGFVNYQHYDPTGAPPNLVLIVLIDLAAASLPAIIGGIVGGQLPKEGGSRQQYMMAAIFGLIFALPCGCGGLWLFSGG